MIQSTYSNITCGEACWTAKENVCKCSCNGENHGILLKENGEQPVRNAKINGYRYELKGIGKFSELYNQAEAINNSAGPYRVEKYKTTIYNEVAKQNELQDREYKHYYNSSDNGAPAKYKRATSQQLLNWIELKGFTYTPYLLWVLVENKEATNE